MRTKNHPEQDVHRPPGFTLVELLVVIMIIMVLVAMMMPTLTRVRLSMLTSSSFGTMRTIEAGCELFKQDFGAYPPSGFIQITTQGQARPAPFSGMPKDIANSTLYTQGGPWLVQCLVGINANDGQDGYGFKSGTRTVNGPYGAAKDLPVAAGLFVDSFQRPFLYYRFDSFDRLAAIAPGKYYAVDNPAAVAAAKPFFTGTGGPGAYLSWDWANPGSGTAADINAYASLSGTNNYYRKDYLLISSGADGMYMAPQNQGSQITQKSDDITNMLGH